jgi:hypothetical protein
MSTPKRLVLAVLIAVVFALAALECVEVEVDSMPSNAHVLIDPDADLYFAPPCVKNAAELISTTAAAAHEAGFRPAASCQDEGAFVGQYVSALDWLLIRANFAALPRSRWNADGSWNW